MRELRSARRIWLSWWAALSLLSLIAIGLAASSGRAATFVTVALGILAAGFFTSYASVRWSERGLRSVRQLATDLGAGSAEPFTPSRSAEQQAALLAVSALASDLRGQLSRLREERDQLNVLVEFGTEGLLQINQAGRIIHVNPAAARLLALPADARGQSISTTVRNAELRDLLTRAAVGEAVQPIELVVDDRQIFAVGRGLPNRGGALVAIIDLTAIRRLEAVRRDFVANVSHELKTPLTSIRGYTETLMADDLPAEMRKYFLEVVQKNTDRIQRIVDDLLDLSRLQSGGWTPEIQDVDVADLVADVWSGVAGNARAKSIHFDLSASGHKRVAADPGGLRQVLSNLYDNAIRHTAAGGRINVRIVGANGRKDAAIDRTFVEIMVQDTGSGIPRDALPRIFERFYRVDPARSRAEGGTGLGLSIVKHLVERMEGGVTAESELGKGTTIRIRLPAA